jgi:hypothetical protein
MVSVEPDARAPDTWPLTLGPLVGLGEVDWAQAGPAVTITARRAASSNDPANAGRRVTERIFDPGAPGRNVTEVTPRPWCPSPLRSPGRPYGSRRNEAGNEPSNGIEEVRRC